MFLKYTFPVEGKAKFSDNWPIHSANFDFSFLLEQDELKSIEVTHKSDDPSEWPTITKNPKPGVQLGIHIDFPRLDELHNILRTFQALVSVFADIRINFENAYYEWIPENDEERKRLQLTSFTREFDRRGMQDLPPTPYDLIARSLLAAKDAQDVELPLSFYQRGNNFVQDRQYIQSFYDFYFLIETLYGQGKTRSSALKDVLVKSKEFLKAIDEGRELFLRGSPDCPASFRAFVKEKSVDDLIEYLIKRRGYLHHHTMKRKDIWHPNKQEEFKCDAFLLQAICFKIVFVFVERYTLRDELVEEYVNMSKEAGARKPIKIVYSLRREGVQIHDQEIVFHLPGTKVSQRMLTYVEVNFLKWFQDQFVECDLIAFVAMSEDGSTRYSEYRSFLPLT